ncbi:hypothetical protein [Dysosmobacter welbionis]|uniref:hypothetical protein n=2 Tax=Dysosmobacter welbionis TaxID=2093857 RepID=UPI002E7797E5|nr:hypothetical protein [Dysosmobacter welbionis]
MERYTEKHYDGNGYYLICSGNCETLNCGDCGILDKIVDRLAAYEDTSLEPEEIISAIDMAKIACALHELNAYKELGSIDCLRKLAGGPGETSTITNGGKIRAMDDDRLAQEILRRWRAEMEAGKFEDISTRWCDMKGGCVSSKGYPRPCTEDRLLACIKRWLQQPAEEDT